MAKIINIIGQKFGKLTVINMGRIISDKDYQILISALANERQQSNIQNQ